MKIPKIKTDNLKKKLALLPKKIAQRSFFFFLILSLFFWFLTALFYRKFLVLEKEEAEIKILEFDQKSYKKILEILKKREEKFNFGEEIEIRDLFRP